MKKKAQAEFTINQKIKNEEVVRKFKLENAKPYSILMETGYLHIDNEEKPIPNNTKYRQARGDLLHIAIVTTPDISAAINILRQK